MAYADKIFKDNLRNVLDNGVWDTDYEVRPRWSDGTPANTKYITSVFNSYDIQKEGIPITTLRPVAWKTAIKELLWIWQDMSNDVNLLKKKYNVHYWDSWMDKKGTLNKSYGYQLAKTIEFPEGRFNQVERIIYLIKNDPMNRRITSNMLNLEEMSEMTLAPCAYGTWWSVRGEYLDLTLLQRSQDAVSASNINIWQYFILLKIISQITGYKAGKFNHFINNWHIYNRHINFAEELLTREEYPAPTLWINPNITDFYDFTIDDFQLIDYQHGEQIKNIPIAI